MGVSSGFFNSLNGDRKYNSKQISDLFDGILNDGVFSTIGTSFVAAASSGMVVNIGIGRGWFRRTWIDNDSILPITLDQSEITLPRIDAIVIEVDSTDDVRANTIKKIKGVPASSPVAPTMVNTEDVRQYPICYIAVGSGVTTILQENITNKIGTTDCPFVTGVLETVTIEGITLSLESRFNSWFDNIKDQLSEDAAGNLQNQIDNLPSQIFPIGTIMETLDSSFGPDWALANGDEIVQATYPELYAMANPSPFASSYTKVSRTGGSRPVYYSGKYYRLTENSTNLYVSDTIDGTQTLITLPFAAYYIKVVGAYLVVFAGTNGPKYAYSTNGTTWTAVTLDYTYLFDMTFDGTYYYCNTVDNSTQYCRGYYGTNIGALTLAGNYMNTQKTIYGLDYANGYLIGSDPTNGLMYWTPENFRASNYSTAIGLGGSPLGIKYDPINDVWGAVVSIVEVLQSYQKIYYLYMVFSKTTPLNFDTANPVLIYVGVDTPHALGYKCDGLTCFDGMFYVLTTSKDNKIVRLFSCDYNTKAVQGMNIDLSGPGLGFMKTNETPPRYAITIQSSASASKVFLTGLKHLPILSNPNKRVFVKVT